ncbi:MAG: hypothetical protein INH41_14525 [Myxococcaceae bacterium]|nr:hypothetical protein [Myxococcaceae bacterium]
MLRLLLACCTLALLACPAPMMMTTPDAGPVDAGVVVAPTEACERLATATCALKTRCYAAFQREPASSCVQNEQARCLAGYTALQQSFERALVRIEPARLAACEQRMKSSACPPTFPPDFPAAVARPFADCSFATGLLVGAVSAGETCVNAQECVAGTVCVKPAGVCRGVCSTSPKEGEPCAFGCATGLTCNDEGRCARLKPLDTPCEASGECEADLICFNGACRPRRKLGDSCAFDPVVPSVCEPGLACDVAPFVAGAVGTCVRPQPADAPCRFHWSCQPGLACGFIDWAGFPQATPRPGFCTAPGDEGTTCRGSVYARFVGDQCKAGSTCDPMTELCAPSPARGQACRPSRSTCAGVDVYCKPSGSGDTGTCTGPAALNEPCAFAIDRNTTVTVPCATGYCDRVNTLTCRASTKPLGSACAEDAECASGRCAVQPDRSLRCTEAC